MHDENLHITPDPEKGFPQPEIPADEAWNNMAGLLDAEMPVSSPNPETPNKPPSSGAGGILGGISHFWGIALVIMVAVTVVTWGVLHLTNKPEKSIISMDSIDDAQKHIATDSSKSISQNNLSSDNNINPPQTTDSHDTKRDLPLNRSTSGNTVQSSAFGQKGNNTKYKQDPAVTISSFPGEPVDNSKSIIPIQPGTDTTNTLVKIIPEQQPVIEEKSKNTFINTELQSRPPSPDANAAKSSDQPVPTVNTATKIAGNEKPDGTKKTSGPEESKKLFRLSENLAWQIGLSGNIGQVMQKGRDANMYYGGMGTGGLWHKKLKAGIETGLGWEVSNDYGSVTNNIRITDSISGDSLNPVKYIDTTQISAYKYQYQYLQVPLFISKQLLAKRKFSLDIKTGLVFSIKISERKTTDYTSGPENGEILSIVNNDYSRLKISWQWQVMFPLRWNFNNRLSLTLSPSGIFYLNNLYEKNNRPANMPFGIGLNGGLIYNFK
jgi:hypothetical protein